MRRAFRSPIVMGWLIAASCVSAASAQPTCPPDMRMEPARPDGLRIVHGAPDARDPADADRGPLVLTLAPSPAMRPGQPIRLAIAARNDTDTTLRVVRNGGEHGVELHLYLEDEARTVYDAGPNRGGCGVVDPLDVLRLRPRETIAEAFVVEARIARPGRYRAWIVYTRCRGSLFRGVVASDGIVIDVVGAPYTLAAAALSIDETVVDGALSREDARATTERARGTLSSCFAVSGDGVAPGTVIAEWRVGEAGTVTHARITGGSIEDSRIRGCILREVRHLSYPASTPARVRQVISLAPIDATAR